MCSHFPVSRNQVGLRKVRSSYFSWLNKLKGIDNMSHALLGGKRLVHAITVWTTLAGNDYSFISPPKLNICLLTIVLFKIPQSLPHFLHDRNYFIKG